MSTLIVAAVVQEALMMAVPAAWWVPDVVLAAMVQGISRRPSHWLTLAAMAALWQALWAVRAGAQLAIAYVAIGWIVQMVAGHVDTEEWRVQALLSTAGCAAMTGWALWAATPWSWALVGLTVAHALLTGVGSVLISGFLGRGFLARARQVPPRALGYR